MQRFLLSIVAVLAVACAPADRSDAEADAGGNPYGLRGRVLAEALPMPDVVFTDTDGRAYDLRRETDGYLTLLFFGYTHCPDVCPIHMANIGAVVRTLRPSVAARIKVLFVTTDPARDTPERIRTWLDNFDSSFIGLTGDTAAIATAQRALWLPPSQLGPADSTGNYLVGHAAAVVAFTPDRLARVMYPFGIRQADWAHDLPKLLEIQWSGS
ncbi:MAG: SCO family protein [Gemmatimonadota bacterium]|nr:SCO family protein [Gemmatimonadota bacterium]